MCEVQHRLEGVSRCWSYQAKAKWCCLFYRFMDWQRKTVLPLQEMLGQVRHHHAILLPLCAAYVYELCAPEECPRSAVSDVDGTAAALVLNLFRRVRLIS